MTVSLRSCLSYARDAQSLCRSYPMPLPACASRGSALPHPSAGLLSHRYWVQPPGLPVPLPATLLLQVAQGLLLSHLEVLTQLSPSQVLLEDRGGRQKTPLPSPTMSTS